MRFDPPRPNPLARETWFAFELPQAASHVARTGRFAAVICLGCLIRGETPHFDYIAQAAAHCDRLVKLSRDSAEEATKAAARHGSLASVGD